MRAINTVYFDWFESVLGRLCDTNWKEKDCRVHFFISQEMNPARRVDKLIETDCVAPIEGVGLFQV